MARLEDAAGRSGLFTDGDWILSENMTPNGGIGVIQLKHVGVGQFLLKDFQFISDETFKSLGCTEVRPGDILISRMADPIGRACVVPRLPFRAVTAVDVSILRVDEEIADRWFVAHLCNSPAVRRQVEQSARGTTRSRITRTELGALSVPLPALEEQRRIASRLGIADRLRRARRNALETSEGLLGAVFLEMFASALSSSALGLLGDHVVITGGGTPSRDRPEYFSGHIPWLTSKDMKGDYIWDTEEHVTEKAIAESATKLVSAGSVLLVVKSKVLMHRLPVAIARVPLCHGQDIKSMQVLDRLHPEFLRYLLKHYERRLLGIARGANTEGLTLPMLEELPVPNVSFEEQLEFASIAQRNERFHRVGAESFRQAEHLFQTLLHEAFGEERVG